MNQPIDILLVEDDRDDVELLEEALKNSSVSFTLNVIMQGDKLLPWLNACAKLPDVIVLDLNLPKLHGKEVLPVINSEEKFGKIPLIVLSTSSVAKEKEFCLKNGASDFITKPTTVAGFNNAVALIVQAAKQKHMKRT